MPEEPVARIISTLGLDVGPAIQSLEKLSQRMASLDSQLERLKAKFQAPATGAGLGTGQLAQVEKYQNNAALAAKRHADNVKELSQRYNVLASQLERRASWFLAGAGFYGALGALRQAVTTITEVEAGMTQIARVTEDASFHFQTVRDQLLALGAEYGMGWKQIQDIALRWAQAGYNVRDTLELTRASLLALNTAELDAQYATQGLIAIMAQWGLTADQLLPVIDKINKVADDYAVTSQDLIDGLMRSSGAARVMGLSLEETIGILTTMREATGRTGKEVGNALNSILSFIQRPKATEALERLGIAVWADKAKTKFRSILDILSDMAAKWQDPRLSEATRNMFVDAAEKAGLYSEEMAEALGVSEQYNEMMKAVTESQQKFTDAQQRDAAQAAAGIYRRNYLVALLQNWAKVAEVVRSQEEALGYSMRENERTMQTLEKQYQALKTQVQELAVALGEAGLMDQLRGLVGTATDAVSWFNNLDDNTRRLIFTFLEVAGAVRLLEAALKAAGAAGLGSALLQGWSVPIAARNIAGIAGAATAAGTALRNLASGLLGLFGGPLGFGLTVGGTALLYYLQTARKEAEETKQAAINAAQLANEIGRLRDRYVELANIANLTAAQKQELADITSQLVALLPQAVVGFDAEGNALLSLASVTQAAATRMAELRAEHEAYVRAQAAAARAMLPGLYQQLKQQQESYQILAGRLALGPEMARGTLLGMTKGIAGQIRVMFADSATISRMTLDQLNALRNAMESTRNEIAGYEAVIKASESLGKAAKPKVGGAVPRPSPAPDLQKTAKAAAQAASWLDRFRDALEAAVPPRALKEMVELQAVASKYARGLSVMEAAERVLQGRIEKGIATRHDLLDYYNLLNQRMKTLRAEQERLQVLNKNLEAQLKFYGVMLDEAQRRYARTGGREAVEAIKAAQDAIENLNNQILSNKQRWYELQSLADETALALKNFAEQTKEAMEEYNQKAFDEATSLYEHQVRMGRLSTQEQISYLRQLYNANRWTRDQIWKLEEDLFDRYREAFNDIKEEARKAYEERIKEVERAAEAEIEIFRQMLDALDQEATAEERMRAAEEHEKKLEDLYRERLYHQLRTGVEHARAIEDIDRQIAEEQTRWQQQQADWAREDLRESYNKQIEDIQKRADEEKKRWEKLWNDIEAAFDDHNLNLLAAAATYDQKWYEDGLNKARLWVEGFKQGSESMVREGLTGIGGLVGQAPGALPPVQGAPPAEARADIVITRGEYSTLYGGFAMPAEELAKKFGLPLQWKDTITINGQQYPKYAVIGGHKLPLMYSGGRMWAYISDLMDKAGYKALEGYLNKAGPQGELLIKKAHTGAMVTTSGIAELKAGELVFPPDLSRKLEALIAVLSSSSPSPAQGSNILLEPKVTINNNLAIEDPADVEFLTRQLGRAARNAFRSSGRVSNVL